MSAEEAPLRQVGLDLVRVLGVLAILAGHVWYTPDAAHLLTYSWHVPIFYLLAGYLWHDGRTVRAEVVRRWSSIVVPYVLWWIVVALVYVVWSQVKGYSLASAAYYLLLAGWGGGVAFRPFTAFWFFSAFVVAVLFVRLLQGRPQAWTWAGAVLAIVACHLVPEAGVRSPLAAAQGVGCALFILVGMQLQRLRPRLTRPGRTGVALLLAGAGLMALPPYDTLEIKSADFGTPVLSVVVAILLGIGLILVAEQLATRLAPRAGAAVTTLATCATVTMLFQGVPMLLMGTPRSGGLLDFVVVVAASVGVALVVRRTPWAPWLAGTGARG